jgi:hypothetical protein
MFHKAVNLLLVVGVCSELSTALMVFGVMRGVAEVAVGVRPVLGSQSKLSNPNPLDGVEIGMSVGCGSDLITGREVGRFGLFCIIGGLLDMSMLLLFGEERPLEALLLLWMRRLCWWE